MKEMFKLPSVEVIEFSDSFVTLSTGGGQGQGGNVGGWGDEEE